METTIEPGAIELKETASTPCGYNGLWPSQDFVLLRLIDTEYKGSIIVPETAKDAPSVAEVLAFGPGLEKDMFVKKGDKVMFAKYSGAEIKWDGEDLLLLRQSEIVCYIQGEIK